MMPEEEIWQEWDAIEDALAGDVVNLERALARRDSPTLRRAYCRAVLAYAEGIAGWMKRYVILLYHPGILGDEEKAKLDSRDGALQSIFKALDLFTNLAGAPTPLKEGSREWKVLRSAIKIRNRVTHAEKAGDVQISDADLEVLRAVRKVITDLIRRTLFRSATSLLSQAKKVKAAWKVLHASPARRPKEVVSNIRGGGESGMPGPTRKSSSR